YSSKAFPGEDRFRICSIRLARPLTSAWFLACRASVITSFAVLSGDGACISPKAKIVGHKYVAHSSAGTTHFIASPTRPLGDDSLPFALHIQGSPLGLYLPKTAELGCPPSTRAGAEYRCRRPGPTQDRPWRRQSGPGRRCS